MASPRRNTITHDDAIRVAAVAGVSGVLAALSGAEPAGTLAVDIVLCFALGAFVTWIGASTPWWGLLVAAGVAAAGSVGSAWWVMLIAWVAVASAMWLGTQRSSMPMLRASIAGAVVQVALRFHLDNFFLLSALVALVAIGLVAITGWRRRQRYVRRRVLIGAGGVAAAVALAVVGLAAGGLRARSSATAGYRELLLGLELLQDGDLPGAAAALRDASADLHLADGDLTGVLTQPARLVPVVAQNRDAMADVLGRAADAADAAAITLDSVDLDQLTIVNGVIDIGALAALEAPLGDLEATVNDLRAALDDADSPWLVDPLQVRVENARGRAAQVGHQAIATSATARIGPALLGADGERRYLFAFTNPAEQRGTSGLMGNWSEVTISNGRLQVTANGRTAQLQSGIRENGPFFLDASAEFFGRYEQFGAGSADTPVAEKFWSNATMPPDMPTVGAVMAEMYSDATGRAVDGVFVIDPAGIAALLDVTGPIVIEGLAEPLTSGTVEEFLTLGQYAFVENEREDLLAAVTEQTIEAVLTSSLPAPQVLAEKMAPAAVNGHVSVWVTRPDEQELITTVGMDNTLPRFDGSYQGDGLAVVTQNSNGNKIDSFLQREVRYTPRFDSSTGEVEATLEIVLTNSAPTTGYPDYVIGNIVGLPTGTNRMIVDIYSRLGLAMASVDGSPIDAAAGLELGWNVYTTVVQVPPGASVTVAAQLTGKLGMRDYELVIRPQALPNPDLVVLDGKDDAHVAFTGPLQRRTRISAAGAEAWR